MYEAGRCDGLHDVDTMFHEGWFSHSKIDKGDTKAYR
jgi:hypothetical protein